jgi:hypothetical protein
MKKRILYIITLAANIGVVVIVANMAQAQTTDPLLTVLIDQSEFPQVTAQPVDQAVLIGSCAVLSVQANNADGYQWLQNGVPLEGQTNSALVIQNAGINDVGLYSCAVSKGAETVPTRAASVSVETTAGVSAASLSGGGPITVFGTPYSGGGSKNKCPGRYAGYVIYTKPASQGWGWAPIAGVAHTAADGSGRTDTRVEYGGLYGDIGCAQTSVSVNPAYSSVYRFAIYFTNNVPTNAYPITLTGFNP